jgi:uncharacterized protein YuzE
METRYDSSVDAVTIYFDEPRLSVIASSVKLPSNIFGNIVVLDLNKEGRLVSLEVIGARYRLPEVILRSRRPLEDGVLQLFYDKVTDSATLVFSSIGVDNTFTCCDEMVTFSLGAKREIVSICVQNPAKLLPASLLELILGSC